MTQEALGQDTGEGGDVQLNKIGKVPVEQLLERIAHGRVITTDCEHAPAAQQVEILLPLTIEQVLTSASLIGPVESDRSQQSHHLFIEVAGMQAVTFLLPLGEEMGDVQAHGWRALEEPQPFARKGRIDTTFA